VRVVVIDLDLIKLGGSKYATTSTVSNTSGLVLETLGLLEVERSGIDTDDKIGCRLYSVSRRATMTQTIHNLSRRIRVHKNEAGKVVMIENSGLLDYAMKVIVEIRNSLKEVEADKFSGNVETVWSNGGFREPNGFRKHPKIAEFANIEVINNALKAAVPPRYTGKAIFKMNGGEVYGKPTLTP
jgi:hypothetical protein